MGLDSPAAAVMQSADAIGEGLQLMPYVIIGPLLVAAYCGLIVWKIGLGGLLVVGSLVCLLVLAQIFRHFSLRSNERRQILGQKTTSEVDDFVDRLHRLKLIGVEPVVAASIEKTREQECRQIAAEGRLAAATNCLIAAGPLVAMLAALLGSHLNAHLQ